MSLRYKYQTLEFDQTDIHLKTLRNKNEFSDPKGIAAAIGICSAAWPIFGVVWPSSIVLANHLHEMDFSNLRVLEVGCGIALPSILLNHLNVDITATDHHPEANQLLDTNTQLNNDKNIPFSQLAWKDLSGTLGKFDLIIGSDLLYEDVQVSELADFIDHHAAANCTVILVDPGRGRKSKFGKRMEKSGFEWSELATLADDLPKNPFKGYVLTFTREHQSN